jgi:NAD(P)-dependent dehydrogenase (short-subunit alcohol dehydrogenase family)
VNRNVALVTGGNSGIGLECAHVLARAGWHVVIASRNRAASATAVARIVAAHGPDAAGEMGLDLGSLADVRRFAADVESAGLPIRALICNAGVQVSGRNARLSPDGYELTFAVNHLGHFLLTHLLLARLAAHPPARIVVVSSGVHDPRRFTGMPKPAVTDVATLAATGGPTPGTFSGPLAYVNSKLCNLWFAYELHRRAAAAGLSAPSGLAVLAWEPGLVPGSGLARDYPPALRFAWERVLPALTRPLATVVPGISTPRKSGAALAHMLLAPELASASGQYFPSHTRWRPEPSSPASYDTDRARALWEASVRMTGLAATDSPLAAG